MNKYILTSETFTGEIEFRYSDNTYLCFFEIRSLDISDEQLRYIIKFLPVVENNLQHFEQFKTIKIAIVPPDLSFDCFWEKYNHKVGNKERVRKLWEDLPDAEKIAVFKHLPRYDYYLKTKPYQDKVYPQTFLSQKRYYNEFNFNK